MCVYEKKFRDLLYALNFTLLTFYRCVWKEVEIWDFFTKSGLCSWKGMCDRREMSSINCELNKFSNILDVVSNWHKSTATSPQRELRAECCVWFLGVCPGWAGPPTHRCLCWLHLDSHQEYHDQAGTRGWHHCLLWHWGYYHHHQICIMVTSNSLPFEIFIFCNSESKRYIGLLVPSFDHYQCSKWKLNVLSSGSTHSFHHLDMTMRRHVPGCHDHVSHVMCVTHWIIMLYCTCAMDIMQAVICHSVCQAVTWDAVLMSAQHRGMWNNFITWAIKICLQAIKSGSLQLHLFAFMTSYFIISAINNLSCYWLLTLLDFHISNPDNQHHWCFPFLGWMFVILYLSISKSLHTNIIDCAWE